MARKFHRKSRLRSVNEINVTPLIDLAFALLIIFMIATPLLEQTIALDLPEETQKPQNQNLDENFQIITIGAKGKYFWGKAELTLSELEKKILALSNEEDPPVIHIRADQSIPYQKVITVIDLIKKYNLSRISLDTRVSSR